jgi:hypothetical protein
MQKDPMVGMDLTSDPQQSRPSPDAKVAWWARRSRKNDDILDLTDSEAPSRLSSVKVRRTVYREASTLALDLRIWKVVQLRFGYNLQGPLSVAASLCAVVLLLAIVAALLVPHGALPAVAVCSGLVLVGGVVVLLYRLRAK